MSIMDLITMSCLVYGPARTREDLHLYKFLQPLILQKQTIATRSLNQNGLTELWSFGIREINMEACPGYILAQSSQGSFAALKGLHTGAAGDLRGAFLFEDNEGRRFKALISCPVPTNPLCTSAQEVTDPWEIF